MTHVKKSSFSVWLFALLVVWIGVVCIGPSSVSAADDPPAINQTDDQAWDAMDVSDEEAWLTGEDEFLGDQDIVNVNSIADPLEPLNRVFFQFNDTLYYFVVKPVSTVYKHVVAEGIRISIRNFFKNLSAPVRVVNNLLQGKVKGTGVELARFTINTTVGIAGFGDPATDLGFMASEEDLGQTLGVYGIGDGLYLHWPVFGPSSLRDSVGKVGDAFLEPMTYLTAGEPATGVGVYSGKKVNDTSLALGDYELFKKTSLDPYIAMRNAYYQFRQGRIHDRSPEDGELLGRAASARKIDEVALVPEMEQPVARMVEAEETSIIEEEAAILVPQGEGLAGSDATVTVDTASGQSTSAITLSQAVNADTQRMQSPVSRVRVIGQKAGMNGIPQRSSVRIIPGIIWES